VGKSESLIVNVQRFYMVELGNLRKGSAFGVLHFEDVWSGVFPKSSLIFLERSLFFN
jgi:hypothetical protein